MRRAVRLAARGRTTTLPNPVVGCVLLSPSGAALGEGWHERPGGPHAEVVALAAAGPAARGATAVVTLEPCAHTGRTGPCADALISARLGRVVVAITDPDRSTAGQGIARLRNAGHSDWFFIYVALGAAIAFCTVLTLRETTHEPLR
jgi:diaminohydroxyphosphoribosylaminopyrimidine deaminase/5-amino-6-(5-phosphoribosylamino)uracil reductase